MRLVDIDELAKHEHWKKTVDDLRCAPIVDAIPVVHSMWVFNKGGSGTCQNCHRTTKNVWDYDTWMRYCPDCGAKMDAHQITENYTKTVLALDCARAAFLL